MRFDKFAEQVSRVDDGGLGLSGERSSYGCLLEGDGRRLVRRGEGVCLGVRGGSRHEDMFTGLTEGEEEWGKRGSRGKTESCGENMVASMERLYTWWRNRLST